jgi:hypothetical protein
MKYNINDAELVKKISKFNNACTNCKEKLKKGEVFYFEIGVKNHLYTLISSRFCINCDTKFGEKELLGNI